MELPLYQVDAFSRRPFGGNPAAVVPLTSCPDLWLPDAIMQAIAAENNLAETAFYNIKNGKYHLRWFTPTVEVDLCGHATLATAAVILQIRREIPGPRIEFDTRSGTLAVTRTRAARGTHEEADLYTLDFPSYAAEPIPEPPGLFAALCGAAGPRPLELYSANYRMAVFATEAQVRALTPDMRALAKAEPKAIIVTAPGPTASDQGASDQACDFVSRLFAPAAGIPEDPVTGSAHCMLTPFWSQRLAHNGVNKPSLFARQVSARGGELWCTHHGDRVAISGHVAPYLQGTISI